MKRKIFYFFIALLILYGLLLIPTESTKPLKIANKKQFVWNRDSLWLSLESLYANLRKENCSGLNNKILKSLQSTDSTLAVFERITLSPSDPRLSLLENKIFYTAAMVGACNEHLLDLVNLFSRIRNVIKRQSQKWDLNEIQTRSTLYKLIYGGRAAVEELLLQGDKKKIPPLILGSNEVSGTPSTKIQGTVVHSGDILVSRGGAPTSALIARGSDYPGNFSHIALVYVDDKTQKPYIIESHIERGVTISSIDDYLNDKKLRIMVLRLRSDLPIILKDKMIPHKAAKSAFDRASEEHIPYDFEMNYDDNSKLFCSEVASSVYKKLGVDLWMGLSSISSQGVAIWLSGFGVKYFITQEPSDLEYDPQLTVVAEWRNSETLFQDHIDNAIIEAMLDEANNGKELKYDWYLLPVSRIMKLYSLVLNMFEEVGPIPEGMSPESGLRHKKLVSFHEKIKSGVEIEIDNFKKKMNYVPPYWKLVSFAKNVISIEKLFDE